MARAKIKVGLMTLAILGVASFAGVQLMGRFARSNSDTGERPDSDQLARGPGTDLDRLQGGWEVKSADGDGFDDRKALADRFRSMTLVFNGNRVVTYGMPDDTIAEFKLDSDPMPKRLEITQRTRILGESRVLNWTYDLSGDNLTIVFRKDNERPTATSVPSAAAGWSKTVRLSLKRVPAEIREWQPPANGPTANDLLMFAAAAKQIEQAKTMAWKTTMYPRRTRGGKPAVLFGK